MINKYDLWKKISKYREKYHNLISSVKGKGGGGADSNIPQIVQFDLSEYHQQQET